VTTAVLVPLKAFDAAKARLDGALDRAERDALARHLADGVLSAASSLPTWVVCDTDDVAVFAADRGASVVRQVRPGLNGAVADGVEALGAAGHDSVLVAHGDLARPEGLVAIAAFEADVVLVPDRRGDGTNVLVVPTAAGFAFAYGPGSFAAHRAEANRLGLTSAVVDGTDLGWDVDTPADLGGLTSPGPPRPV
jgi:2-phospho-L-lactate/phosphoenolpyruvate guanylyltransferase